MSGYWLGILLTSSGEGLSFNTNCTGSWLTGLFIFVKFFIFTVVISYVSLIMRKPKFAFSFEHFWQLTEVILFNTHCLHQNPGTWNSGALAHPAPVLFTVSNKELIPIGMSAFHLPSAGYNSPLWLFLKVPLPPCHLRVLNTQTSTFRFTTY